MTKGGPDFPLGETKVSLYRSVPRRFETNPPLGRPKEPLVESSLRQGETTMRKFETNQRKYETKMTKFEVNQRKERPAERNAPHRRRRGLWRSTSAR